METRSQLNDALAKLDAAADLAAARGSLLFHLDLASEVARAFFEKQNISSDMVATIIDESGYQVVAFDPDIPNQLLGMVRFDAHGEPVMAAGVIQIVPRALTFAHARMKLSSAISGRTGSGAAVVIPSDDPSSMIEGYLLRIADDPSIVLLTGHCLVQVSSDGHNILNELLIDASQNSDSLPITRVTSNVIVSAGSVPRELHTYLSLKHGVPMLVETIKSGLRWRVDGEHTRRLPHAVIGTRI